MAIIPSFFPSRIYHQVFLWNIKLVSHVYVLVFHWGIKNYYSLGDFKQHPLTSSGFQRSECGVARLRPLCSGSHKAEVRCQLGWHLCGGSGEESAFSFIQAVGRTQFLAAVGLTSRLLAGCQPNAALSFQRPPAYLGTWPFPSSKLTMGC